MNKFIILICNLAHSSDENPVFSLLDENENTVEFDNMEDAENFVRELKEGTFPCFCSYSIVDCNTLDWM